MNNNNCRECIKKEDVRKFVWRQYFKVQGMLYEEMRRNNRLTNMLVRLLDNERVREVVNEDKSQEEFNIPPHFRDELLVSMNDLNCCCCLEDMTKENFNLTKCFHKVCKGCMEQLKRTTKKCPICRKLL